MAILDRIAEGAQSIITAAILAVGGGIAWLVRRVLTNQQEIALLRQHLEDRDRQRDDDREAIGDVREGVRRIESWIMERGK